ncbi:DUF4135 domain-containing protein [Microbacterium sp. NPDC087591]|uniref:DUF4135 domain-containing protein n=1 Tax=Microbacterium sp. NPDC087591 TaxID=3364192 RepID=UPI003810AAB4
MPALTPGAWIDAVGESELHNWPALLAWDQVRALFDDLADIESDCPGLDDGALIGAFISSFVTQTATMLSVVAQSECERVSGAAPPLDAREMWEKLSAVPGEYASLLELGDLTSRVRRLREIFAGAARDFTGRIADERTTGSWVADSLVSISHLKVLGDVHTRGAVLGVYSQGRPVLVYKPRSLAPDTVLSEILDALPGDDLPRSPRTLDRGVYGWQEYVVFENIVDERGRADYYRRFGGLVAFANALGMQDLHYENIKCSQGAPFIIDAECAFGVGLSPSAASAEGYFSRPVPSILSTLLVPNWAKRYEKADPYDPSALGSFADPARQSQIQRIVRVDGELQTTYERLSEAQIYGSQPYDESVRPPFADHGGDVCAGFRSVSALLSEPRVQELIVSMVQRPRSLRCRVLTRATASFMSLLQMKGAHRDRVSSEPATRAETEWLLQEEARQLDRGCVPVFEVDVHGSRIVSGTGASFDVGHDPFALWVERFSTITDPASVDGQAFLLERTIELGLEDPDWSASPPPAEGSPHAAAPRPRSPDPAPGIEDIVAELSNTAHSLGEHVWWASSVAHSTSRHELFPTRSGVYDGLAGIVLAAGAAALDSVSATALYQRSSESLLGSLERFVENRAQRGADQVSPGLGEGPLGAALALAEAARLNQDHAALERLARSCALLDAQEPVHRSHDYLNGAAGVVVASQRLCDILGDTVLAKTRARNESVLIDELTVAVRRGLVAPGLAHGLSGVALALAAMKATDEVDALIDDCFDLEQRILASTEASDDIEEQQKSLSGSWCWGAGGQLEARLQVGRDAGADALRERLQRAALGGMSLCHGGLGRVLLQQSGPYVERWGLRDGDTSARIALQMVLDDPSGARADPPYARRVGLFTGMAGSLFYLSAQRDSASVLLSTMTYDVG